MHSCICESTFARLYAFLHEYISLEAKLEGSRAWFNQSEKFSPRFGVISKHPRHGACDDGAAGLVHATNCHAHVSV